MDVTLLKRVLFTLFTDQRLWIAAGAALLIFLIATLTADGIDGVKPSKANRSGAKKPLALKMPKMPSAKKKKEAPPPELDDDDPGAGAQ